MKKFLSILLAVMMVLSTVSFAAPSAVGTMETANETVVDFSDLAVEEVVAELAAEVNKASYGTLIYKVDFENDNFDVAGFSTAYKQLKDGTTASYINSAFDTSNATCYTNATGDGFKNAALVTEGGNTYIKGDVNAGYSGFFRMTKYNCAWPEGYYTFAVDVKAPAGQVSSFAQQCNDTAVAIKTISAFNITNGDWQTVVNQTTNVVNGADIYGFFVTPNSATAGTVSYDNWEVYYRPATVTLTIAGEEYEVSTDAPVSVASLASKVSAPTGYELKGVSLTEGGEVLTGAQYFFEDATLYPVFAKDTTIHDVYGKPLFIVDFENEAAQTWWGHSEYDNSTCSWGAQVWTVATKYDARFDKANFRIRFITNEGTHGNQGVAVDADGNHYNKGTTLVQWPNVSVSNWGNVMGEAGVYTYVFDRMISGASSVSPASPAGYDIVDNYDGVQGVWDKVVLQKTLTEAGKVPDGNIANFSLAAADKGVAEISYDNFILYYKPLKANVTLIANGEEYVAEDISTAGVSADSIVAAAGVEIPYGKKAVLSELPGGESIGNVINLAMDSTYYVSFVDDDSITEYGKRLLLVDFENFNAGDVLPDNMPLAHSTDNFNGDWGHLTINYEVGTNTIVEEDGNKIVKGQQGWAQIRINNANFATAPAGIYTMALKVKNYGTEDKYLSSKEQVTDGVTATWVKAGDATGTNGNYFVTPGVWNEVAAELPKPTQDFTIYHTNKMTSDVAFDDIALYYRPASVNITVVDAYGDETVYEDVASAVNVDDLLADVKAPFGYKVALSAEKNGEPLTGTINLVSDAKLYVVLVPDETVSFDYGEALFIIDFEKESMQGWDGNSQTLDNSVGGNGVQVFESASYYDSRFEGKNYRVRFVINEAGEKLIDQDIVADENGNHYTTGTNTTQWSQVCSTNWGNIQGDAGVYTFMYDVKVEETTETGLGMTHNALHDGNVTVVDGFSAVAGEWDTVVLQVTMDAAGNLPKGTWGNFNFGAVNTTKLSFDNAKLYFKPLNANVELVANGAVVATKTAATSGVLVSELVSGVKVKGFTVTGVKLGADVYGLEDTVVVPCDCQLELALEVQDTPAATPETVQESKSVRVETPVGLRFKAALNKAELDNITEYGWIVTREKLLGENELTMDFDKKVTGYGKQDGENLKEFFSEDDETAWFTGVLYFSETDADGLPSVEKLAETLVACPFVKYEGEYLYGEVVKSSIFEVALALYNGDDAEGGNYDDLDEDVQDYFYSILCKVDEDANDIPDIYE